MSPPITPTLKVKSHFYSLQYHSHDEHLTEGLKSPSPSFHPLLLSSDPSPPPSHDLSPQSMAIDSFHCYSPPIYRVKRTPRRSPSLSRRSFSIPIIHRSQRVKHKKNMKASKEYETTKIKISCSSGTVKAEDPVSKVDAPIKRKNSSSISDESSDENNENSSMYSKKAKTDAAVLYDNIPIDGSPTEILGENNEWIPNYDVFNKKPNIRIIWKASPLKIHNMPYYEKLHAGEAMIASTLRLTPEQYLKCKWALILAAQKASDNNALFRKSEAQKVCCIDVNKTSILWNTLGKLGWLGAKWPH